MGHTVIVAYAPKPGQEAALLAAVDKHMTVLRAEGFVTDRAAHVMRAANGTILEVFEWKSAEIIGQAHKNPALLALWAEFEAACTYVPLAQVPECQQLFAGFESIG